VGSTAALAIAGALERATGAITGAQSRVDRVKRAGMLMDDADVKLEDAHQSLVVAQVEIHTVDPARVDGQTKAVLASTGAANTLAAKAEPRSATAAPASSSLASSPSPWWR
jgi:hypothetical protein